MRAEDARVTLAQDSFKIAPPVTRVTGTLAATPKQVVPNASFPFPASLRSDTSFTTQLPARGLTRSVAARMEQN